MTHKAGVGQPAFREFVRIITEGEAVWTRLCCVEAEVTFLFVITVLELALDAADGLVVEQSHGNAIPLAQRPKCTSRPQLSCPTA